MRYLLFLAFAASSFAQESAPARKINLRLLAFEGDTAPKESYVFDPAAPNPVSGIEAPIKGYLNHEGMTLDVFGNKLIFAKSKDPAAVKDKGQLLAEATLPASGNQFMLIFLPAAGGSFQVLPIDDSLRTFPLGSYHVINLSRSPVRLMLEKKPFDFKPGQSAVIDDPPVQSNQHSSMSAFAVVDGKAERIGSGNWPHPGRKRSIQVFFDNPLTKRTELRGFRDVSPPGANAPAAANDPNPNRP